MSKPTTAYYTTAIRVMHYLKISPDKCLFFLLSSTLQLEELSDFDWETFHDTRRSVNGYCIYLGDSLISWKLKKQLIVSHSSIETEYHTIASTICKIEWFTNLLKRMTYHFDWIFSLILWLCIILRLSVNGYCIYLCDSLISWKSKKQPTVSSSSTKVEYRTIASTICEIEWFTNLLKEWLIPLIESTLLYYDYASVKHIFNNSSFSECTTHIDMDCHFVW